MVPKERPAKLSMVNTKKEMLEEYQRTAAMLQEEQKNALRPEKAVQEKKEKQSVERADATNAAGVEQAISTLRMEVSGILSNLSDKFAALLSDYRELSEAVRIKKDEIQELYEIEKSAETLAALIEAQHKRKSDFEAELANKKEELEEEIRSTREAWKLEQEKRDRELKEFAAEHKKRRDREREEYEYAFNREKQTTQNQFADEKDALQREITKKRQELEEREKNVADRETKLADLQQRVDTMPKEIDEAVETRLKTEIDRITREAKAKEDLLKNQFEGERNVFTTKIAALEQHIKEQDAQLNRLSAQMEKSYQQVQDIAVKAIEGTSTRAASAEEYSRQIAQQQRKSKSEDGG